jgi:hypothetical protein
LRAVFTIGKSKETRWCQIRRIGWVAHLPNTVFGQKYLHYQYGMGRGSVVEQEPTALCSKLCPLPRSALQQSSNNLNVESTIDSLPFRHKFFMNHSLFVKKCDQYGVDLGLLQKKHFGL